jgi:2-keto-3-deoxy-galactonokinase
MMLSKSAGGSLHASIPVSSGGLSGASQGHQARPYLSLPATRPEILCAGQPFASWLAPDNGIGRSSYAPR